MPLVAIAAIGAAGSIGGGLIASHGANKAADTQAQAALQAAQIQAGSADKALNFDKLVYGNQQLQLAPYLATGASSMANLANLLGVLPKDAMFYPTTPGTIPGVGNAAGSTANLGSFFPRSPANVGHTAMLQGEGPNFAVPHPFQGNGSTASGPQGVNLSSFINPELGSTGDLMKPFQWQGSDDPSFQFRIQEGQKALERSAAAKGGLLSGGTAKAIDAFAQNMASDEYQNSFQRYRDTQADRFNRLATLAGYGPQAVSESNRSGTNAATNIGSILLASGNAQAQGINNAAAARASGYAGSANAWSGALSNTSTNLQQLLLLKQMGMI